VNACLADCYSTNKDAFQSSTLAAAGLAVDGDVATFSCTQDSEAFPWWAVDLGQVYEVGKVTITYPNINGDNCNYRQSVFIYLLTD